MDGWIDNWKVEIVSEWIDQLTNVWMTIKNWRIIVIYERENMNDCMNE